jgi:hypothetical protein
MRTSLTDSRPLRLAALGDLVLARVFQNVFGAVTGRGPAA